uniref:Uncharacterized protein n=1 Tax=Chromera velia CCMP2878 TaxID=1169474 RepID=A0A0G4GZ65_9ALVE|eukprot:Cvel_24009.t1-p1 / transcript=Cvel_24009.t1 / gene=Cvel_24009 / organism=Chromera_velia_CCMP2878 / gene_product=hypothetical protein / transcript_product=hypothetical protein / location=Cvel_scaffold2546:10971-11405(+) / protein_length=145 / sequence_SO=supercontig / SO=protein_coding / is_pseudo=false
MVEVLVRRIVLAIDFITGSPSGLVPSADSSDRPLSEPQSPSLATLESEKLNEESFAVSLDPVLSTPSDCPYKIPVAKRITGEEKVFVIGNTCGTDLVDQKMNVNGGVAIKELGQVEALAFTSVLTNKFAKMIAEEIREAKKKERR